MDVWDPLIYLIMVKFACETADFPENVSGYACNHGSLRIGNEKLRPLEGAMGNAFNVTGV